MSKKILMVDDEPDILKIVKFRLLNAGYEVIFASNGQEGVDLARAQSPDLIIMDYRMPILNGIDAAKLIKKDAQLKHIPILFMTASSATITEDIIKAVGIEAYLTKPFEADILLQKVKQLLEGVK
jgi:CheY-like chemotaxis protein